MSRWTLPMTSVDPYIWVAMITLFVATSIALLVLAALPLRAAKAAAIAEATKESGGGTGDAIPRDGVSLEGLLRFQREVARVQPRWRRALAFLTGTATAYQTTEDVDQLAKAHLTSERRCAYVEMLDGNPEFVGEATVFISHAWKMRFDTLVDCVREADAAIRVPGHPRYKPGATPYFWIDLLVSDQHSASSRPFTWFEIVFRETVERIGHTVVALEWEDHKPLGRAWCLWEMFCATTGPAKSQGGGFAKGGSSSPRPPPLLELSFPLDAAASLRRDLEYNIDLMEQKLCRIDLRNVDAFHGGECRRLRGGCPKNAVGQVCPDDKGQILKAIEASQIGLGGMTKRIIAALRYSIVGEARVALAGIEHNDKRGASLLQFNIAKLLNETGRRGEAEGLLREFVEISRRTRGNEHADTLSGIGQLATILNERGEATSLNREALDGFRRTLGSLHESTLTSMGNLALLLQDSGNLTEAEQLFREALAGKRRVLGNKHQSTLASIDNLAGLLQAQGKYAEAEALQREDLEGSRRILGNMHPDTLVSINNLALLLQMQGKLVEAEPLYREALDGRRRVLGDERADTLACISSLALLLRAQGRLVDAEQLFREALAGRRRTLGDEHPSTLKSKRYLESVLREMGKEATEAAASTASTPGPTRRSSRRASMRTKL